MKHSTQSKDHSPEKAPKGNGEAVATLQNLRFTDIRGEYQYGNVYLVFTLNNNELGVSQFIEIAVMKEGLEKGKITLPSEHVRTYVKFGAQAWVAQSGFVEIQWDREALRAQGTFELAGPTTTNLAILNGLYDVTIPESKKA